MICLDAGTLINLHNKLWPDHEEEAFFAFSSCTAVLLISWKTLRGILIFGIRFVYLAAITVKDLFVSEGF